MSYITLVVTVNQFKARPDVEWRTAVPSSKRKKLKSFQSKMSKKIGFVSNLSKLPMIEIYVRANFLPHAFPISSARWKTHGPVWYRLWFR